MANTSPISLPFKNSHAFIIGINAYQHVSKLKSAVKDAKDIAAVLETEQGYSVHTLYDANQAQLMELLGDPENPREGENPEKMMRKIVQPDDRVFFYFAGHGIAVDSEKDPEGYLVPLDAESRGKEKLIKMDFLHKTLIDLKCKHGLLVLDCCFAGSFKWSTGFRSLFFEETEEEMYEERFLRFVNSDAWQVITSSAQDQRALDLITLERLDLETNQPMIHQEEGRNSPFAAAFKQALEGQADVIRRKKSDGVITASELYLFLRDSVEAEARKQGTRQSPAIFTLSKHDTKGEFIFIHPRHPLTLSPAPDFNPYRGLRPYGIEEAHAKIFFGRTRAIEIMVRILEKSSIMVISAPSGQGKSSTVQAGLIPFLQRDQGYKKEHIHILRPGNRDSEKWDFMDFVNPAEQHLILIDQYEEIFTEAGEFREEFEEKLLHLVQQIHQYTQDHQGAFSPLKLIITLRSDFEWQVKSSTFGKSFWLEAGIRNFLYHLPPMTREELCEAMVKPARMVAYEFESEKMINYILREIHNAPGGLPLLSFALHKLYELRDRPPKRMFTWKAYIEGLGGINGALSNHADAIYEGLPDEAHRQCMRKLMLRMVRLNAGSYTRRRVYLESPSNKEGIDFIDELNYFPNHLDIVKNKILKILENALLLIRDQDEFGLYVEPMHDSLLNFWPRCQQWIQDFGKENLILQRQVWQAVLEHHQWKDPLYGLPEVGEVQAPLWDHNPKLQQIQLAITDPNDQWLCKKDGESKSISSISFLLWEGDPTMEQMAELEAWNWFFEEEDPKKRFQKIRQQMDPWLNEDELAFVKASFEAQRTELERIKAERNEAVKARERAEEQTRIAEVRRLEAEALAISANARSMPRSEMIPALQLAKYAYAQKALPQVSQTLAAIFYEQFGKADGIRLPLFAADLNQHPGRVSSAIFSSDGQSDETAILTTYEDGSAKLWNLKGKLIREITHLPDSNDPVIFSPDGQSTLEVSDDGIAQLKNLEGILITEWNTDSDYLISSIFSSNGQHILTVSDSQVKLWNLKGELKMVLDPYAHNLSIYAGEFSPNGEFILTASMDKTAKLWNLQGELVAELDQHTNEVYVATFSPDGQFILTASRDTTAKLWNLEGALIADFDLHTGAVNSAVFSDDGQYILTSSTDNTVKLWRLSGELLVNFSTHKRPWTEQHTELENSAIFSPDEQYILTHFGDPNGAGFPAGIDHATKLWTRDGKLLVDWNKQGAYIGPAVFSADGQIIHSPLNEEGAKFWTLGGDTIENSDINLDDRELALVSRDGIGNARIFSPNRKYHLVFSEEADHIAQLWNDKGDLIAEMNQHTSRINTAVFSPDGQFILTASWDKTAKLWNIKGEMVADLTQHTGSVKSAIFSPNGRYILTTSIDQTAKLWNLKGDLIADLNKHHGYVDSAIFSSDSQFILTASYDGSAKLWPVPERIFQYLDKESAIPELSMADKGKYGIR